MRIFPEEKFFETKLKASLMFKQHSVFISFFKLFFLHFLLSRMVEYIDDRLWAEV